MELNVNNNTDSGRPQFNSDELEKLRIAAENWAGRSLLTLSLTILPNIGKITGML